MQPPLLSTINIHHILHIYMKETQSKEAYIKYNCTSRARLPKLTMCVNTADITFSCRRPCILILNIKGIIFYRLIRLYLWASQANMWILRC